MVMLGLFGALDLFILLGLHGLSGYLELFSGGDSSELEVASVINRRGLASKVHLASLHETSTKMLFSHAVLVHIW